jgi:hypothetical protein
VAVEVEEIFFIENPRVKTLTEHYRAFYQHLYEMVAMFANDFYPFSFKISKNIFFF